MPAQTGCAHPITGRSAIWTSRAVVIAPACYMFKGKWEVSMLQGIMVPILAIVVLALIWTIVLYGSSYFGPRT